MRPVFLEDLSIPDDVERTVRSYRGKALEILAFELPCTRTEYYSLVLAIGTGGDPLTAPGIIESENR